MICWVLGLSACGTADPDRRPPPLDAHVFPEYGVVQSMELIQPTAGHIGVNPMVGSVYRFSVRMDNGDFRYLVQADNGSIRVGDVVRIEKGMLMR